MTNAREIDGDPHEVVAELGVIVTSASADLLEELAELEWAARGAWMTAEFHRTGHMPEGEAFKYTPYAHMLGEAANALNVARGKVQSVAKALSWNPKSV